MTSSAPKQTAYRARRDAGMIVLRITVNEVDFVEDLKAIGLLRGDDPDRAELQRIGADVFRRLRQHWRTA